MCVNVCCLWQEYFNAVLGAPEDHRLVRKGMPEYSPPADFFTDRKSYISHCRKRFGAPLGMDRDDFEQLSKNIETILLLLKMLEKSIMKLQEQQTSTNIALHRLSTTPTMRIQNAVSTLRESAIDSRTSLLPSRLSQQAAKPKPAAAASASASNSSISASPTSTTQQLSPVQPRSTSISSTSISPLASSTSVNVSAASSSSSAPVSRRPRLSTHAQLVEKKKQMEKNASKASSTQSPATTAAGSENTATTQDVEG